MQSLNFLFFFFPLLEGRGGYWKEVGVSCCLVCWVTWHGKEGQARSSQSHRVWPLTGALRFGRGRLIHTYTHLTHGECFAYRGRVYLSVCVCVCDVCICKKKVTTRGSNCFSLLKFFSMFPLFCKRRDWISCCFHTLDNYLCILNMLDSGAHLFIRV